MAPLPSVPGDFSGSTGPFDEAQKLLDYVIQAATESNAIIPSKQYVTAGQEVDECEQVVATLLAVQAGLPSSPTPGPTAIVNCALMWRVTIDVSITRCVPIMSDDGSPPSAASLEQAAQVTAMDTFLLQTAGDLRAAEQWGAVAVTLTYPIPTGGYGKTTARYEVAVTN